MNEGMIWLWNTQKVSCNHYHCHSPHNSLSFHNHCFILQLVIWYYANTVSFRSTVFCKLIQLVTFITGFSKIWTLCGHVLSHNSLCDASWCLLDFSLEAFRQYIPMCEIGQLWFRFSAFLPAAPVWSRDLNCFVSSQFSPLICQYFLYFWMI